MNRFYIYFIIAFLSLNTWTQTATAQDERERDNETEAEQDSTVADTVDTACPALPWPAGAQAAISELLDNKMFETSQVGLLVYDLTADSIIYRHNDKQMLRPASTMKVVTAVAALDRLGGSYQFRTSLYYTGKINDNTLTGDIYCVGGFDPLFNSDDMKAFVESIKQMSVDTIRGRIVADKTMKDGDRLGEGWCWDDKNPTLSPLLISRKDIFTERFVEELREAGVTVEAFNTEGEVPAGAFAVCTRFHTMDQILVRMMKDSDNLFAESMFYQIAAASGNKPAKAVHARTAIRNLIRKSGLQPANYKIADGSGLSLYNYVSAELEVALLRYAYKNSEIFNHLYHSLPVAGEDGTLKSRMRSSAADGNVHAKTGTLTGIRSLAGYCTAANGHLLCFAIINQGLMNGSKGKAFQDKVCTALCRP